MRLMTLFICLVLSTAPVMAQFRGQPLTPVQQEIQKAMQSDIRTDAERGRDRDRNPVQTLGFFGLEPDMKVIEIIPAGGWYTKLLAPVLHDKGVLYITQPDFYYSNTDPVLQLPGLDRVKKLDWGAQPPPGTYGFPGPGTWDIRDADLVLTFRNYHNLNAEARAKLNAAAFSALRPGGRYGVVDHTRRHMEPDNTENGRRVDPVMAIKEIQAAGFRLVDYSTVHFKPDDELRYEVGRPTVTGNTDRFTLLFEKP